MWSAYYPASRALHCFSQHVSVFILTPKGGTGQGRERRTESLSSLQLLLRTLVWFSLLLRIHFHNRQQAGAVSVGLADLGGHSSDSPVGIALPSKEPACSWEPSWWAVAWGRALMLSALSVQVGTAELGQKWACEPYEKWGGLLAVDFPRYFGDAKHGRLTTTFSDPIGSSSRYNAVFLPLIPGQQPALGGQHRAPHCVSTAPEPFPQDAHLPRCRGFSCDQGADNHLTMMVTNGAANSCWVGPFFFSLCQRWIRS